MMLVLVACLAVFFWAWRRAWENSQSLDLASMIRTGSSSERIAAMGALWQVPPEKARNVAPVLFSALDDPDPKIRAKAAESLFYVLQTVDDPEDVALLTERLLLVLEHPDPVVRSTAASLLGRIYQMRKPSPTSGSNPSSIMPEHVVNALLPACDDPEGNVRGAAVASLAVGMGDRRAKLQLLLRAADDPDPGVRSIAVDRLFAFAHLSREACLVVVRALNDPALEVYSAATRGSWLAARSVVPSEAIPDLIQALHSQRLLNVRMMALSYLEAMGPSAKAAIPAILTLRPPNMMPIHDDGTLRALGAIAPGSPEARAYIPTLLAQAGPDQPAMQQYAAIRALAQFLWDPQVLAMVQNASRSSNPQIRDEAIHALNQLPLPAENLTQSP